VPTRGEHHESLPGEALVLRLVESSTGKVAPEAFILSTADKAQNPPLCSVFDSEQTTPEQAHRLMGEKPAYTAAGFLPVVGVRSLDSCLDVIWDHVADSRPGALGHCGIKGLEVPDTKAKRAQLRRKLADLANEHARTGYFRAPA
jgi:hypothetical protein